MDPWPFLAWQPSHTEALRRLLRSIPLPHGGSVTQLLSCGHNQLLHGYDGAITMVIKMVLAVINPVFTSIKLLMVLFHGHDW